MNAKTSEALQEVVLKVIEATKALPAIEFPVIQDKVGKGDEEVAVLVVSDMQIGHQTPTTNAEVIRKRADRLVRNFLKVVAIQRKAYPVRKCHIFLLGDIVHSEMVGRTIGLDELEMVLSDQMFGVAIPLLEKMIATIRSKFDSVEVHCEVGNHGRLDKMHADTTNMDGFVYRFLQERMKNQGGIKINFDPRKFYGIVDILGWKFLLMHGDAIRMTLNLPWYGITTRAMRLQGSVGKFDYMVLAHFHVASFLNWNDTEIITNGCFVTDDQWVLKVLGMASTAKQVAFGVHPDQGITWRYQIRLD